MIFKDLDPNSSTFQGLEFFASNSRTFQYFLKPRHNFKYFPGPRIFSTIPRPSRIVKDRGNPEYKLNKKRVLAAFLLSFSSSWRSFRNFIQHFTSTFISRHRDKCMANNHNMVNDLTSSFICRRSVSTG